MKPALSGQSVLAVTPPFPTGDRSIKYRLTVVIEHTVKENLCNTHTIVWQFMSHKKTIVYCLPSTVYRLPSTVHRLPSTVYRLPSTVYLLPSIAYRPPSTTVNHLRFSICNFVTFHTVMENTGPLRVFFSILHESLRNIYKLAWF